MKRKRLDYESEPLINRIFALLPDDMEAYKQRQVEVMRMHHASSVEKSVPFNRKRLGDQDYTWVGEFRYWVWETPDWRVYANNHKGTCFEVRADLTDEQAFAAWDDYLARVDLKDKELTEQEKAYMDAIGLRRGA